MRFAGWSEYDDGHRPVFIVPELRAQRGRAELASRPKERIMTVEQQHSGSERAQRPRPTRAQRIVAAAFLGAFGLTMLTVLLTGLWVRAPRERTGAYAPAPAAAVERREP